MHIDGHVNCFSFALLYRGSVLHTSDFSDLFPGKNVYVMLTSHDRDDRK